MDLIGQEVTHKQRSLHVGASLGIHLVDGSERDIDVILKVADEAMYQAKRKGKGQFVFSREGK